MDLSPRSFAEGLEARLSGPGKGRFIVQPLVAIALGIRDGIRDARDEKPPYFLRILFKSERKLFVLKSSLRNIAMPLTLGIVFDLVVQWMLFQAVRLIPALMAGTILVAFPYAVARGLSNRAARRWYYDRKAKRASLQHAAVGR